MDQIFIIWITSIILSLIINFSNIFKMVKDIYNSGYKININAFKEINNHLGTRDRLIILLIPIINIMQVTKERIDYNNSNTTIINMLDLFGTIDKMTLLEEETYQIHPTVFRALLLDLYIEKRLQTANKIEIRKDSEQGDIYYEIENNLNEIKILTSTKDMRNKPNIYLINIVKSSIYNVLNNYIDTYINNNIELNKQLEKLTRQEKIAALKELKQELLEQTIATFQENNIKKRTRKK